MREPIKHYTGYEITDDVIRKINLIELKRIKEGLIELSPKKIETIKDICRLHGTFPEEENLYLGADWYIIYTKFDEEIIEISDWLSVGSVPNKLVQTMEMYKAMKNILLQNKNAKILATMRHSTSYKFYKSLLDREFIEAISERVEIDDELPKTYTPLLEHLKKKYQTLEEYLLNSDKENLSTNNFNDYIYHLIIFKPTDKFIKKYTK